jgi:5'-deoxynucleotidase YfbR-like HD superfamily hydrolase
VACFKYSGQEICAVQRANMEKTMSYIQTLSGKKFNYLTATIDDIDVEDIATALSNICRFAGHLPEFYSVAQHSVLVSQIVPPEFAFEALMHDAAEAYCQDIPAPLKALLPDYQRMETYIDGLIRFKFGISLEQAAVVKYADLTMLATERRDLEIDDGSKWEILEGIPCSDLVQVIPLRPGQAYGLFMNRFNELVELRQCAA